MFNGFYFFIFFGRGVLIGFNMPVNGQEDTERLSVKIFGLLFLLLIGLLIWDWMMFAIGWTLLSSVEALAGLFLTSMITGRIKSD